MSSTQSASSQKWTSSAGPLQTKAVNKAIRDLEWRGKTFLVLSDYGEHESTSPFGQMSAESAQALHSIGEQFQWTVTRENCRAIVSALESATSKLVLPTEDNRTTADEREEMRRQRAEQEEKRRIELEQKRTQVAKRIEELRTIAPWAISSDGKMSEHARAAKNIRKELSIKFPGVKFSVTSESFSMGDSVDIRWTDGPTSSEVDSIVGKYKDGSFDGMVDMYNYDHSAEGEACDIVFGRAKYVQTHRKISDHLFPLIEQALCEAQGVTYNGQYTRELFGPCDPDNVRHHASRLLYSSAIPVGAAVTGVEHDNDNSNPLPYRLTLELPTAPQASIPQATTPATTGARIEKHHHTKRGFDMWLVIPVERLDRTTFETYRTLCEAADGWYSRQWGRTPSGFAFKDEGKAILFAAEMRANVRRSDCPDYLTDSDFVKLCNVIGNATTAPVPASQKASVLPAKLRELADSMDSAIEDKLRDSTQNWTPKRGVQEASRKHEGRNLQAAQVALRALADAHEAGTCPPLLADITTKKEAGELTATRADTSGGYYSYVPTNELRSTSPKAAALRSLVESRKTEADREADVASKQADELARKIDALRGIKIEGFFPTPAPVVSEMIDAAELADGQTVLEPSAGIGSIADQARESAEVEVHCVEVRPSLTEILMMKGHRVTEGDFLTANLPQFDRVLMNPPFERAQDVSHVRHAFDLLKPGGRLVALMADSAAFRNGFSSWLSEVGGTSRPLPPNSFNSSDAFNRTGVNVRMVVIDKPHSDAGNEGTAEQLSLF